MSFQKVTRTNQNKINKSIDSILDVPSQFQPNAVTKITLESNVTCLMAM